MNDLVTVKSMAEVLSADKKRSNYKGKLYKEMSDEHKCDQITQDTQNKLSALKQTLDVPRVDLSNTKQVQDRAFMYLEACSLSASFPSVMGLSGAMGCSRQNLNRWLLSHPDHPTTNFVNMVKDTMADILTNASLFNTANPVQTIFQLKNHFEHVDRIELAPVAPNQSDNDYNADEIRKRYMLENKDKEGRE
ncbi:MAG: hypothetical protein LKF32_01725 [Mageeibacillus sp.]|nr:hypothetical protein [Mageeibacillus sp.]